MLTKLRKHKILILLLGQLFVVCTASAVTEKSKKNVFITDPLKLKASLQIPTLDKIEMVKASKTVLKARTTKFGSDPRIEDLQLRVPGDNDGMHKLADKLAALNKSKALFNYFAEKYQSSNEKPKKDGTKRVSIQKEALDLFSLSALSDFFAKTHHNVTVLGEEFGKSDKDQKELLKQLKPFFAKTEYNNIRDEVQSGKDLNLEKDLLPTFARKMVRQFLVFRGPNCFHASLAFHGQYFTKSKYVNIKAEEGYHRSMINYDELWRALQASFYEVNVDRSPMKYGDLVIFFDLPTDHEQTYFRWIRHAAVYLFGPYTFSKGSKSPDTPYTLKTMDEEWTTWRAYSKNLGVKVFRRTNELSKVPPLDLTDWVY